MCLWFLRFRAARLIKLLRRSVSIRILLYIFLQSIKVSTEPPPRGRNRGGVETSDAIHFIIIWVSNKYACLLKIYNSSLKHYYLSQFSFMYQFQFYLSFVEPSTGHFQIHPFKKNIYIYIYKFKIIAVLTFLTTQLIITIIE